MFHSSHRDIIFSMFSCVITYSDVVFRFVMFHFQRFSIIFHFDIVALWNLSWFYILTQCYDMFHGFFTIGQDRSIHYFILLLNRPSSCDVLSSMHVHNFYIIANLFVDFFIFLSRILSFFFPEFRIVYMSWHFVVPLFFVFRYNVTLQIFDLRLHLYSWTCWPFCLGDFQRVKKCSLFIFGFPFFFCDCWNLHDDMYSYNYISSSSCNAHYYYFNA